MKSTVDVKMHALRFLYDHLADFPGWIGKLTPKQLDNVAQVMLAWQCGQWDQHIVPLDEVLKRETARAVNLCDGDVVKAAKALGVGKTTLYRHLRKWGYRSYDRQLIHQASALADLRPADGHSTEWEVH